DGHYRDFEHGPRLLNRQAPRVLCRADVGRQRIAGIDRDIGDGPALHPFRRPVGAFWIDVACRVTVVARVRVNNAADGAVLVGQLGLQTTPTAAVTSDYDSAFHADAAPVEFLVIVRHALVHINQVRGHIP